MTDPLVNAMLYSTVLVMLLSTSMGRPQPRHSLLHLVVAPQSLMEPKSAMCERV
jgi:hypothetical protein